MRTNLARRAPANPLCLALLVVCCAGPASAQTKATEPDVIVFKNGDRLSGRLEHGAGNSIVFRSDMAGEMTLSLNNVREMHTHGNFAVLLKNVPVTRGSVQPGPVTYGEGQVHVEGAASSSSVPVALLGFIVDQATFDQQRQEPPPWRGWRGAATAGATDVQSTNYGTTFTVGLNLARVIPSVSWLPPRNRSTFNINESYGKLTQPVVPQTTPPTPDSVARTNIFHADFERDEYLRPRFYILGDLTFDHNYAQGLGLQQVYGSGFGWTPLQNPLQQLDLKADAHYEKQLFQPTNTTNQDQNLIGSTFAESYRRALPGKIVLTEAGSVLPAWNNPNAYSASGSINFALPTFKRLTVNVGTSDSFINDPPAGFRKNSFQFTTGIGYAFQ